MAPTLDEDAIPRPVREVCERLHEAGHRAWIVGGCIRDLLMGEPVSDWDLATSARPEEVQAIFRRTIPTGLQHGTVTVLYKGEGYEVTTLRGEGAYSDGRRPDNVEFVRDLDLDLERRDFTVNAIALDPLTGELVDPFDGIGDLARRRIRAVRDPALRFGEDGLRVLRAARFAATLGFRLDPATEAAIPASLDTFRKVSAERVHEEWKKALTKAPRPSRAFDVMRATGILGVTCPRLAALAVAGWDRAMVRVDGCPRAFEVRLAGLLLDVGGDDPKWADGWLRGLRCSNQERKAVLHLLAHGRVDVAALEADEAALRRWLAEVGRDALDDVLAIAHADGHDVVALRAGAEAWLARGLPLTPAELPVGGGDVMAALDVRPGRVIGDVLEALLARVLDDPSLLDRDRLLALVPEAYRESLDP